MLRREFLATTMAFAAMPNDRTQPQGCITDVAGIKVGHFTDSRRPTGCTVVLCEQGAVAGVDVRGGAPGTIGSDVLRPENIVDRIHGVVLTGGSAYGLAAVDGVNRYLEEKGFGFPAAGYRVPITGAAVIFDLPVGDGRIRPTAESGYKAAAAAKAGPCEQGNVGAGAGATIGKMLGGEHAMKGGLGTASIRLPAGLIVGAIMVVNAVGDVIDPATGQVLAGARTAGGKLADLRSLIARGEVPRLDKPIEDTALQNTTIGVVATNAALSKTEMTKVAQMAHDGLARAVHPAHMPSDGDTIFALSTGALRWAPPKDAFGSMRDLPGAVGALAAQAVASAIVAAVLHARGIPRFPAHADLKL